MQFSYLVGRFMRRGDQAPALQHIVLTTMSRRQQCRVQAQEAALVLPQQFLDSEGMVAFFVTYILARQRSFFTILSVLGRIQETYWALLVRSCDQEVPEYQLFLSIASTGLVRTKDFHVPREPFK